MVKKYKFDMLVFIGRFQPFHLGHKEVVMQALSLAKEVIVVVGSSGKPSSTKNPWSFNERMGMIMDGLDLHGDDYGRVRIAPLHDQTYNDQKWAASIQAIVDDRVRVACIKDPKIGVIGHAKDASSYYLKMFPQWELVEHGMNDEINATDLRALLFDKKNIKYLQGLLPIATYRYIQEFSNTPAFEKLVVEYEHIKNYKKSWAAAPYPVTFVTTDAIVVQSGHVLLVQRDAAPGEGLWALPGGFLNQDERVVDGVIRELREETKLKVPTPVLKGSIKAREVFDDPGRSERGRTITHAALIVLPPGELPQVKGSDDARDAKWVPIADIKEENMFEDHYAIIQYMLGMV